MLRLCYVRVYGILEEIVPLASMVQGGVE